MTEAATPSAPAVEQANATPPESNGEPDNQESAGDAIPEWKRTKHKVPLKGDDGSDVEVEYDELVKNYALNKTLTKRGQEAAEAKKQAESLMSNFQRDMEACRGNPKLLFEVAKSYGIDDSALKSAAEELVWEQLQWEKMSESEREAAMTKKELAAYKAKEKEAEDARKAEEEARVAAEYGQQIETTIEQALKLSGLKPTTTIVARMAELLQSSLNAKGELASPEWVAQKVRAWKNTEHQDLVAILESDDVTIEDLISRGLLPDKLVGKIQQYLLKKASKSVPSLATSRQATTKSEQQTPKPKKSVNDYFR